MSCSKPCLCQCEWPVDTHEPKLINNVKEWLIFAVRLLSRMVVMKVKGQEAIWNKKYKPSWWDDEKYGEWKNPTTNGKDTIEVLLRKYEALEYHSRKEGKFPTDLEEEAKLLEKNKIEELLWRRNSIIQYGAAKSIITQLKNFKARFPPCMWDKITKLLSTVNDDEGNGLNTDPESGRKLPLLSSQSEICRVLSYSHCSPSQQQSSVSFNSGKLLKNIVSPSTGKQREAGIDVPSCSRSSLDAFNSLGTGSGCQDVDSSNDSLSSANQSVIPETSAASAPAISSIIPDRSYSVGSGRNCHTDSTPSTASLADLSSASGTSTNLKRRKAQANVKGSKKARQKKFTPQSLKSTSKTSETEVFTKNVSAVPKGRTTAASDVILYTTEITYSVTANHADVLSPSTVRAKEAGIDVISDMSITNTGFPQTYEPETSKPSTKGDSEAKLDFPNDVNAEPSYHNNEDENQVPQRGEICQNVNVSTTSANSRTIQPTIDGTVAELKNSLDANTACQPANSSTERAASLIDVPSCSRTTSDTLDSLSTGSKCRSVDSFNGSLPFNLGNKRATFDASDSVVNRSKDCQTASNSVLPETFSASALVVITTTPNRSNGLGTGNNYQTDSTTSLASFAAVSSASGTCPAKLDSSDSHTDSVFQNRIDSSEISMTNIPSDGRAVSDETDSCVRDNQNSDDSTILKDLAEVLSGSNTTPDGTDNVKAVSDSESPENYSTSDAGCIGTNPILNLNQLFTEEEQHELFDQNDSFLNIVKDFFLAQNSMDVTSDSENC